MNIIKRVATIAVAGAMAVGTIAPAGAAFAQTTVVPVPVTSSSNIFLLGSGFSGSLGQLFVLGRLFGGPFGNGVIGTGTSLGDLLILNQIFNRGFF